MSYEENLAIITAASEVLRNIYNRCEYKDSPYEICGGKVEIHHAMTAYYWDGKGENPNRDFLCCENHYKEYFDYWSEMWRDYYTGIL